MVRTYLTKLASALAITSILVASLPAQALADTPTPQAQTFTDFAPSANQYVDDNYKVQGCTPSNVLTGGFYTDSSHTVSESLQDAYKPDQAHIDLAKFLEDNAKSKGPHPVDWAKSMAPDTANKALSVPTRLSDEEVATYPLLKAAKESGVLTDVDGKWTLNYHTPLYKPVSQSTESSYLGFAANGVGLSNL